MIDLFENKDINLEEVIANISICFDDFVFKESKKDEYLERLL